MGLLGGESDLRLLERLPERAARCFSRTMSELKKLVRSVLYGVRSGLGVINAKTGVITSGIPSPTLGTNIAMGYVKEGHHKKGTKVQVEVRKKLRDAVVRPMPFVPAKYYK